MIPIETEYDGVTFRSRAEARWAVFFDELGIGWDYEPEGFRLADGTMYLPDFRLYDPRREGCWLEVKPELPLHEIDLRKAQRFAKELIKSGEFLLLVCGVPWSCELFCWEEAGPSGLVSPLSYFAGRFGRDEGELYGRGEDAANTSRAFRFWEPRATP